MELSPDANLQEERAEVLAAVRDAMRTSDGDADLAAVAGVLLRHLDRHQDRRRLSHPANPHGCGTHH